MNFLKSRIDVGFGLSYDRHSHVDSCKSFDYYFPGGASAMFSDISNDEPGTRSAGLRCAKADHARHRRIWIPSPAHPSSHHIDSTKFYAVNVCHSAWRPVIN